MLTKDINFRPTSVQCYEELEYVEKLINNPDEFTKIYLEKKNKPYIKKEGNLKNDNHKYFFIDDNKPHQPQTTNKASINPNNNFNGNIYNISNNANFNNNNNCFNFNLNNNNNNNNFNNNFYNNNFNNNYNNNFNNNYNNNNFNNNYNNNNFNNNFYNNNFNNCYNYNNFNTNVCSTYNCYQNIPSYASYIMYQYYYLNQSKLIPQNINNNNLVAGIKLTIL